MPIFQKIEKNIEWQGLLDKALFKTFFHQLDWENFLERQFNWLKFERYLYKDELLLSLARCRVFGKEKMVSHPFCEYGGPLPLITGIDFQQLKKDLFLQFKEPLKINFHPEISLGPASSTEQYFSKDIQHYSANRFSHFVRGFVDSDSETIWRNLRKTTRHEIKKAQAANFCIERCKNKNELEDFYNLYLQKAKQHKIPAYPYGFFEFFFRSSDSEIILAKLKEKVIAGSVFLFYDKYIHYFINASSPGAGQEGANHLILWEQIKRHCGRGKVFDLGGTRKGSSLAVFKQGFGDSVYRDGAALEIYQIRNFSDTKEEKFGLARKIWGILPSFLINKLSPYLLKYKI